MGGIFSRHRSLALLAGMVFAQLLLLAFQIKRDRDVRLIRYWAVAVMSPVERTGTWGFSHLRGLWTGYIYLHNARRENEQLRAEVGQLQLRNRELESQADEARRLSALLNFRQAYPDAPILAAQVIGASADSTSHTLFINRGSRDHIRNNMAVVTPDGVVGKIVETFPSTAQVLLINDKDSGVGALFAASRTHGVVKGSGDPNPRLDYIVNDEKVKAGDVLLTSGDDRIFPKGLLIGTVTDSKAAMPFQLIHVQPAARLDRLEDVLVLLSQQELEPKKTADASFPLIPEPPQQASVPLADPAVAGTSAAAAAVPGASPPANTSAASASASGSATGFGSASAKPGAGASTAASAPASAKPAAVTNQNSAAPAAKPSAGRQ